MLNNKEIDLPINPCIKLPFVFISRSKDLGNANTSIIMTDIDEENLHKLEQEETITLVRGEQTFTLDVNKCFCYGDFDFSPNSKDIKTLIDNNIFDNVNIRHFIPSKYIFDTHSVQSDVRRGKWFDTDNIETYLPFLWGCIGKPKNLVIFKYSNIGLQTNNVSRSKRNVNKKSDVEEKPKYKHKYREERKQIKMNSITFKFN